MNARFTDRLTTIVVTALVVSAGWILFGVWLGFDPRPGGEEEQATAMRVEAEQTPAVTEPFEKRTGAPAREPVQISRPDSAQTATLMIPVLNVSADELVDNFTDERGVSDRLHEAIDIMAPAGASVVAAAPGTIEKLFRSENGGRTVYVRSDDRETIHYYAHLSEYAPGLQEGQKIRRGQRLGTVGSSGIADPKTPHLHFAILRTTPQAEWWEPATALNPYKLLVEQKQRP